MAEKEKWGFFVDAKRLVGFVVVLILLVLAFGVGYMVGHEMGYSKGRRPQRGEPPVRLGGITPLPRRTSALDSTRTWTV